MLRLAVMVSGGGTNLQAILDAIESGKITNAKVVKVISNSKKAYALERAAKAGIPSVCITRADHPEKEEFNRALLLELQESGADLVVLAGCLVVIPQCVVDAYPNRIINIHPALIPSFCGTGYYGLGVHEAVLARGVKVTGATVHFVDGGTDTGPSGGGTSGGYPKGASAACDAGGRMGDSSEGDRSDRKRKSLCGRRTRKHSRIIRNTNRYKKRIRRKNK